MLLWCVFQDAYEWHNSATADCPECRIAGTCRKHWRQHGEPLRAYMGVMGRLEDYHGRASGISCQLAVDEVATLVTALLYAIKYRAAKLA